MSWRQTTIQELIDERKFKARTHIYKHTNSCINIFWVREEGKHLTHTKRERERELNTDMLQEIRKRETKCAAVQLER